MTAVAASPNKAALSRSAGLIESEAGSLLHINTVRYVRMAIRWAAICKANKKLRQVALISKQALFPSGAFRSRCSSAAVHGIACWGADEAKIMALRSLTSRAASASALWVAAVAMLTVVSVVI